jgi:hypothetical protein
MTGEIIGRDAELSVVQAFLDRPVEGLRALVLEGEPGIGKSTLWQAGVAAARERRLLVLTSRPAETEQTLPNVVLGDLFGDTPIEALEAVPAPRRRAFESALLLRDGPGLPVDPRALGVAIMTILPMLGDGTPLVLAIDDEQWADPSSSTTIRFALRRLPLQPILLLLSHRTDGKPRAALEDALDPSVVERLHIGPLSVGAIQVLLRDRLGNAFPRPALLQFHDVSGGTRSTRSSLPAPDRLTRPGTRPCRWRCLPVWSSSSAHGLAPSRLRPGGRCSSSPRTAAYPSGSFAPLRSRRTRSDRPWQPI